MRADRLFHSNCTGQGGWQEPLQLAVRPARGMSPKPVEPVKTLGQEGTDDTGERACSVQTRVPAGTRSPAKEALDASRELQRTVCVGRGPPPLRAAGGGAGCRPPGHVLSSPLEGTAIQLGTRPRAGRGHRAENKLPAKRSLCHGRQGAMTAEAQAAGDHGGGQRWGPLTSRPLQPRGQGSLAPWPESGP